MHNNKQQTNYEGIKHYDEMRIASNSRIYKTIYHNGSYLLSFRKK